MNLKELRGQIQLKELQLGILGIEHALGRFEVEILRQRAEIMRLEEEKAKSKLELDQKQLQLETLLKEH
jgi:hypothetical protein